MASQQDKFRMGQTVTRLRINMGWSKSELAKRLSVDPAVITRIENGTNYVGFDLGCDIAETFGITVEQLRQRAGIHG